MLEKANETVRREVTQIEDMMVIIIERLQSQDRVIDALSREILEACENIETVLNN